VKQTQNEKVISYDYDYNGMRIRQTVNDMISGGIYITFGYSKTSHRHHSLWLVRPLTKQSQRSIFFAQEEKPKGKSEEDVEII